MVVPKDLHPTPFGSNHSWRTTPVMLCLYIVSLAFPPEFSSPLFGLAIAATVSLCFDAQRTHVAGLLDPLVGLFLLSVVLSTLTSVDLARSALLGITLLPGVLLYLLIRSYCHRCDLSLLYLALSCASLLISAHLLATALSVGGRDPAKWVAATNTLLFLGRNDVGFLAIILPVSLTIWFGAPRWAARILGLASFTTSLLAIIIYQSRGSLLAAVVALSIYAMFLNRRVAFFCLGAGLLAALVDGALGFPLAQRFVANWSSRIPLWISAATMFLEAPLLGQGPRTFGILLADHVRALSLPSWLVAGLRQTPWAHNLYLETLAEQGLVGFVILLALVGQFGRSILRLCRGRDPKAHMSIEIAALGAFTATTTLGIYELSFVRLWAVFSFFGLLGIIDVLAYSHGTETRHLVRE